MGVDSPIKGSQHLSCQRAGLRGDLSGHLGTQSGLLQSTESGLGNPGLIEGAAPTELKDLSELDLGP